MWIKENLLNIALRNVPKEAKYIAWSDADVTFQKTNDYFQKIVTKSLN
jgi:hypothetical protein